MPDGRNPGTLLDVRIRTDKASCQILTQFLRKSMLDFILHVLQAHHAVTTAFAPDMMMG